jgi:hypothetical protein
MAPDLLLLPPKNVQKPRVWGLGGRRRRRHPERRASRPGCSGDDAMADLFFIALILAVFVVSALFIPVLHRN